jgi:putative ABC transport system permease protein
MIKLIKLAYRNVLRNKKRSILTLTAVVFGIMALLMSTTIIGGIQETTLRNYNKTTVSQIKIFDRRYFENRNDSPLENLISDYVSIGEKIRRIEPKAAVTGRLKFQGKLIFDVNEVACVVVGVDERKDASVFELLDLIDRDDGSAKEKIMERFKNEDRTCLMGKTMLKDLHLSIGESIDIYTRTVNNVHNAETYTVIGTLGTENPEIDSFAAVLKLKDAQSLSGSDGRISEIDINIPNSSEETIAVSCKKIDSVIPEAYAAYKWQDQLEDLLAFFKYRQSAQRLILFLLLILVVAGIINTMLMAVFERTKEIGTLCALGMKNHDIVMLFLFEGMMIGLAGGLAAILLTLIPIRIVSTAGINLGTAAALDNAPTVIYGHIEWYFFILGLFIAVSVSGLATLYPSIKAVRLNVAQILRSK